VRAERGHVPYFCPERVSLNSPGRRREWKNFFAKGKGSGNARRARVEKNSIPSSRQSRKKIGANQYVPTSKKQRREEKRRGEEVTVIGLQKARPALAASGGRRESDDWKRKKTKDKRKKKRQDISAAKGKKLH